MSDFEPTARQQFFLDQNAAVDTLEPYVPERCIGCGRLALKIDSIAGEIARGDIATEQGQAEMSTFLAGCKTGVQVNPYVHDGPLNCGINEIKSFDEGI